MQIKDVKSILVRAAVETLEDRRLMSTYTVANANDTGAGSLRQAITDANNHAGADTIKFAIGSGARTIALKSKLPSLGDGTTLDATTQPGYAGKPLIELNGSGAGSLADGIKVTGTGVTVKGLAINRFSGSGMLVMGKGYNTLSDNYIGTDRAGAAAAGNKAHGIIVQSPHNTIRNNVISGNGIAGISLYTNAASNTTIVGNKVGTDATGSYKIANANTGVLIGSAYNVVGGIGAANRNIISGNAHDGILIASAGAKSNAIQGNYIGTDATGSKRLGNGHYGIEIQREGNVVGGSAVGAGNVISANTFGGVVMYTSTAVGNRVQGNFVGTDRTGTIDLGNVGRGVECTNGASYNLIGGERSSQKNVISGNDNGGVGLYSQSKMNVIQKNYIGTDVTGGKALGNGGAGITITDYAGINIIGGRRAGNVISANKQGIAMSNGCGAAVIHGNYIGTDVSATKDLGNATDGIYAGNSGNQIGGKKSGSGNIISGNGGDGVRTNNSKGNLIRRNIIGVGAGGVAIANGGNGVILINTTDTPVSANIIARNGGDGVEVSGARNTIVSNSIYGNGAEGINITTASRQALPAISSIKLVNDKHVISGTVTSKANTTIYLELFATTGDGEGKSLIGVGTVKINGSGTASWTLTVSKLASGTYVTATATAGDGSTSEFATSKSA